MTSRIYLTCNEVWEDMGETQNYYQICFTDFFPAWFFASVMTSISSFSWGKPIPVSGVSEGNNETQHYTVALKQVFTTGRGGCTFARHTAGNKLHTVTTWKVPAFSNRDHSWGITARAYLRVRMGASNRVPSANSSSGELLRPCPTPC